MPRNISSDLAEGKVSDVEHCKGFHDRHGFFNNGFDCPKHMGPNGWEFCCGPEDNRYCCASAEEKPQAPRAAEPAPSNRLPLLACIYAAASLLVLLTIISFCYWCRGCPLNQRRKKRKLKEFSQNQEGCPSEWTAAYVNDFVQLNGHVPVITGLNDSTQMDTFRSTCRPLRDSDPCSNHSSAVYETIPEYSYNTGKYPDYTEKKTPSNVINISNYVIGSSTSGSHDQSDCEDKKALLNWPSANHSNRSRMTDHGDNSITKDCQKHDGHSHHNPRYQQNSLNSFKGGKSYFKEEPRYVNQQPQPYANINNRNDTDRHRPLHVAQAHVHNSGSIYTQSHPPDHLVKYSIL